jgi:PqqD family protein of HPr-rel-A system
MKTLPRVRPGLLRHHLDDQVLVYDPGDDKVHLLDPTTACVLDLLEEGKWSAERIMDEVARRVNVAPSEALLALSLDELRKADLLDKSATSPAPVTDVRRREMLRKVGLAGAAALLIPAITTITATPAYAVSLLASGACCTVGGQCQSGICIGTACTNPLGGHTCT